MILRGLIILAVVCFLSSPSFAASYGPYTLIAPVAIDGDNIRADVMIWPDITVDVSIRVIGADTPELRSSLLCERVLAIKARTFTDGWIILNQPLTINLVKPDKFAGRVDAVISGKTGSLADALIAAGIARPYTGGARQPWCQ